jgi:hypothetical protein
MAAKLDQPPEDASKITLYSRLEFQMRCEALGRLPAGRKWLQSECPRLYEALIVAPEKRQEWRDQAEVEEAAPPEVRVPTIAEGDETDTHCNVACEESDQARSTEAAGEEALLIPELIARSSRPYFSVASHSTSVAGEVVDPIVMAIRNAAAPHLVVSLQEMVQELRMDG